MRCALSVIMFCVLNTLSLAAHVVWQSTNGDWNSTASWSTGSVPVDSDEVEFNGTSVVDVTAGLNQTGVQLLSFLTTSSYTGDIGSSGTPLEIDIAGANADWCVIEGPGSVYMNQATILNQANYVINSTNLVNAFYLGSSTSSDSGSIFVIVKSGGVRILSSMTHIDVLQLDTSSARVRCDDFGTNGRQNNINNIRVRAGRLRTSRSSPPLAGVVINSGGDIIWETAGIPATFGQLGEYYQFDGSLTWNVNDAAGDAKAIYVVIMGGKLDMNATLDDKRIEALELHEASLFLTGPHVSHPLFFHDYRGSGIPIEN